MNRLTLGIVGKTLFDADVEAQARNVGRALTAVLESFWTLMLPFSNLLERLPLPALKRSRAARAELDAIIFGMIADRRQRPADRGDLLSMLLLAQDEEAGGAGMSDQQVRDEAMTIFLAGHETTANALCVALVPDRPGAGGRAEAARGGRPGARRTPADARGRAPADVCRAGSHRGDAALPAGVDHRPPRGRGLPVPRVRRPGRIAVHPEPVRHSPRCALVPGPRAVRSRSLDAGVQGIAAAFCLPALWGRRAPLYRRLVRVDGTGARGQHHRAAVASHSRAGPSGRAAARGHPSPEARAAGGVVAPR